MGFGCLGHWWGSWEGLGGGRPCGGGPRGSDFGSLVSERLGYGWEFGEAVGGCSAEDVPVAVGDGVWEALWVRAGAFVGAGGTHCDGESWVSPGDWFVLPGLGGDGQEVSEAALARELYQED